MHLSRRWAVSYTVLVLVLLGVGAVPTWVIPLLLPGFRPLREGQWASLAVLVVPYVMLMVWLMLPYVMLGIAVGYGTLRGTLRHAQSIALVAASAAVSFVGGVALATTLGAPNRATAGALLLAALPVLQTAVAVCVGGLVWVLLLGLRLATRRIGQRTA